jgi:putative ATP-dependent endonuclease of the OLD family
MERLTVVQIRKLTVGHFRGIKSCTWHFSSRFACLVGSGGSTKTTLLDALGLVLSRSYRPQFTDADFWQGDTSSAIRIEVAITDLPSALVQEGSFGWERCGIRPDGDIEHDPIAGTEPCLCVRLDVGADLEPTWTVVRPGEDEGRPISAGQRAKLGFFRLGDDVDIHLKWGRTSALSGMTQSRTEATSIVLEAHRQARKGSFENAIAELQAAADTIKDKSRDLGAAAYGHLQPGLDAVSGNSSALVLHHGPIPLTGEGLGTRRLTSLAIQREGVEGGSIIAIDEVEHGLEPHRLVHLLQRLKTAAEQKDLQVILTTHSPVTVTALSASDLAVARAEAGTTTVRSVDADLDTVQGTVRSAPAALLARRVVVAEGATEVGFVRQLCRDWDPGRLAKCGLTAATVGVAIVNGGGASAAKRARTLRSLGYPCAALLDNDDRGIDAAVTAASTAGVEVLRWSHGHALEDEIVHVLTDEGLKDFVALAVERRGEESVLATVANHLKVEPLAGIDPIGWIDDDHDRAAVCRAVADAAAGRRPCEENDDRGAKADDKAWFKREDGGEDLARLVCSHRDALAGTHLAARLTALRKFIYVKP